MQKYAPPFVGSKVFSKDVTISKSIYNSILETSTRYDIYCHIKKKKRELKKSAVSFYETTTEIWTLQYVPKKVRTCESSSVCI